MYIALKWLISMAVVMWLTLCSIHLYHNAMVTRKFEENNAQDTLAPSLKKYIMMTERSTLKSTEITNYPIQYVENNVLQYVMFVAGACLVLVYNRKKNLIVYTKTKMKTFTIHELVKMLPKFTLKSTARVTSIAISNILNTSKCMFDHLNSFLLFKGQKKRKSQNVNLVLLNKLKEYGQERKKLGHLLIAAIQENKNIRMQYELESMAKTRLAKNIINTQKQMKENRSRYVSFQQLYLVTHQENLFLKSRIKKLSQEKEDAERNLVKLVNYVWQSKNKELQAYCSRFIVQSSNNLLNSDVRAEIKQFLKRSLKTNQLSSNEPTSTCFTNTCNVDNEVICNEEGVVNLIKDAPKLRGLPGEYVWTVKDKDGIIEKLYEYETDFDNGDTIKRIREYSVYCDKDCLLDFTSSTTIIHTNMNLRKQHMNTRHITGSQAFQKFLQCNRNVTIPRHFSPLSY